jgi:hypothetical protein
MDKVRKPSNSLWNLKFITIIQSVRVRVSVNPTRHPKKQICQDCYHLTQLRTFESEYETTAKQAKGFYQLQKPWKRVKG